MPASVTNYARGDTGADRYTCTLCLRPQATLPGAYATSIEVDEIGLRVITNATGTQRECGALKVAQLMAGKPDIDRLAVGMQTFLGDAVALAPQHGIRSRGSISGNHMKLGASTSYDLQVVQGIEQPVFDGVYLATAMIAQQPVHQCDFSFHVLAIGPVGGLCSLSGVRVVEGEHSLARGRGEAGQRWQSCQAGAGSNGEFKKCAAVQHR
jgi:hypothetical protein